MWCMCLCVCVSLCVAGVKGKKHTAVLRVGQVQGTVKWGPNSGYRAAFGLTSWALIGRRYGFLEWRNETTAVTPE